MKITPRYAVVQSLIRVEKGSYSNLVLESYREEADFPPEQSAFAQALLYGVLERRITLDHILGGYSKTPVAKMSPEIRNILRCGVYQLTYMDIPESAAVNESVNLAKTMPHLGQNDRLAGFVNGILRAYLRAGKKMPPVKAGRWEERFSIEASCPIPLLRIYKEALGQQGAEAFLLHSLTVSPTYLRVNTQRTTTPELIDRLREDGIPAVPDDTAPDCLAVKRLGALHRTEAWAKGLFHIQDKSSQLCVLALDPQPGQRLLDVCAAPGGKSLTAAQYMKDSGEILSLDLHESRVNLIDRGAKALGLSCVAPRQGDATIYNKELGLFHRVLCDVPCSGLGVIRRKPDIKYKDPAQFENLPNLQYKILETSSHYVKRGGRLVYSTCTLNPRENTLVAARFVEEHPEFAAAPLPSRLGGQASRLIDHTMDCDGFFIAAFMRKE